MIKIQKIVFWIVFIAVSNDICLAKSSHQNYSSELKEIIKIFSKIGQPLEFTNKTKQQLRQNAIFDEKILTREGRQIAYYIFNPKVESPDSTVLFLGGIHPNEFAASYMSWKLLEELLSNKVSVPANIRLIYVPLANPDGWIDGRKRTGYPTRGNSPDEGQKDGYDINREFVDRSNVDCANTKQEPEAVFIQNLIESTGSKYWVSLHSARNVIELDGSKINANTTWQNKIVEASKNQSSDASIPAGTIGTYTNKMDACKGSLGRLANSISKITGKDNIGLGFPGSITFELPGPGEKPEKNDPNYEAKLIARIHLGLVEKNASLAKEYYKKYRDAFIAALKLNPAPKP